MEFVNDTPFSALTFQSVDLDDDDFQVIVVKAAFCIEPDAVLASSDIPAGVTMSDVYRDKPVMSSLVTEDDLAPFKPASDVILTADAHAPGGQAARAWSVTVSVGKLHKELLVTGPRYWLHVPNIGWRTTQPEPATIVPIIYENAYGGTRERSGRVEAFEHNPAGKGFIDESTLDTSQPLAAPTILAPGEFELPFGQPLTVEGLGPVAKAWLPRRSFAGTYDPAWGATRHPKLPLDFDARFHNCAQAGLVYPGYLRGNELVRLQGLWPAPEALSFSLPGLVVAAAITDKVGYRYGANARLDTVHLDIPSMRACLTWRACLPRFEDGVERVDIATSPMLPDISAVSDGQRTR